jgi:hypothetical protein
MFLGVLAGIYGAFIRLQEGQKHNRELFERELKTLREHFDVAIASIRERVDDHIHNDREDFAELRLVMKADQAASANIHAAQQDTNYRVKSLEEFRQRVERRNGSQPPEIRQ